MPSKSTSKAAVVKPPFATVDLTLDMLTAISDALIIASNDTYNDKGWDFLSVRLVLSMQVVDCLTEGVYPAGVHELA